ncbi:MAG: hypothetical protein JOZ43_08985 [Acidobacteriales bacterium]|nr:hypothetical protein [Terriglobales bacterium]
MRAALLIAGWCLLIAGGAAQHVPKTEGASEHEAKKAVMWREPVDLTSRDLKYGIGGEKDAPKGKMTFVKEDLKQNSPKFDVKDEDGRKWRVKLGVEAKSETAATRLLWAVGYLTDEDYFVPNLQVDGLPPLKRGRKFEQGDHVHAARLELRDKDEKKEGPWHWRKNPFTGTREFNGLRVMMCVLNNWDLKDENNSIYRDKETGEERYVVSDVGATFGRAGRSWTSDMSKDDPKAYSEAKFIVKKTEKTVTFNISQHLPWIYVFNIVKPQRYWQFKRRQWIGRNIPRQDAKWIGGLLGQLSDAQLRDAFVSSGYNDEQTDELMGTLKKRIRELNEI